MSTDSILGKPAGGKLPSSGGSPRCALSIHPHPQHSSLFALVSDSHIQGSDLLPHPLFNSVIRDLITGPWIFSGCNLIRWSFSLMEGHPTSQSSRPAFPKWPGAPRSQRGKERFQGKDKLAFNWRKNEPAQGSMLWKSRSSEHMLLLSERLAWQLACTLHSGKFLFSTSQNADPGSFA